MRKIPFLDPFELFPLTAEHFKGTKSALYIFCLILFDYRTLEYNIYFLQEICT